MKQHSLFEDYRLNLQDSIRLSLESLDAYAKNYQHWAVAFSGGKDSTATVGFVTWALTSGKISKPKSLTILYADTRMEIPPLRQAAINILTDLAKRGYWTKIVKPELDKRFFVYMLGRGVPPPKNRFRWCTPMLKVQPMMDALLHLRQEYNEKLLMLTGVRLGESAARDQRIALSCSKDSGECGQGWFQVSTDEAIADTLAPLLHWRLCHIYDWLYLDKRHGLDINGIAAIYGQEDVRTGCIQCNLASRDVVLERLLKKDQWKHLSPLTDLKPLYKELKKPKWRKRKVEPEKRKNGLYSKNVQRLGPLTMEARQYGLEKVLDIQQRAGVDLINLEEEKRIRELWKLDTWPERWSSDDIDGDVPVDQLFLTEDQQIIRQSLLI